MKCLIVFLIFLPFGAIAQYNDDNFIMTDDTLEVINYLNGTWKLKIKSKLHYLTFNFSETDVSCIDSIHPNWYDETDTRYELKWNSEGLIYLNAYTRDFQSKEFNLRPYSHQLLPMTKRRMIIDLGGDFGVFEIKKTRN